MLACCEEQLKMAFQLHPGPLAYALRRVVYGFAAVPCQCPSPCPPASLPVPLPLPLFLINTCVLCSASRCVAAASPCAFVC